MTREERKKMSEWDDFVREIQRATADDDLLSLSDAEKRRKLARLEADPVEWCRYFFPHYAKFEFAPFQTRAIKRIVNNAEWYEVLSWARSLAKSTITMMCVIYLALTKKKHNVILASATEQSAEKLLAPYKANFEGNGRIKAFYGEQEVLGKWTSTQFTAKCGCSFFGIGAGSAPRGARNEAIRPDVLLVDDFDTDADCLNDTIVDKKWKWFEDALYATRDPATPTTVIFCGNIIAKNCCIKRAGEKADHWDIVNIIGKDGNSSWPEKNTIENINRIRSKVSNRSFQNEYMNNPLSEGKVFHNLVFSKVPPLRKFKFLVIYGDPAPSTRGKKGSSFKAVWLVGKMAEKYYIIRGVLRGAMSSEEFIRSFFDLFTFVGGKCPVYAWLENNSLQNPFFEEVYKPIIQRIRKETNIQLYIQPDATRKDDKFTRIEAALEPLDRSGFLIFNEEEKDSPDMTELREEFTLFEEGLPYHADGADCIQGAKAKIDAKFFSGEGVTTIKVADIKSQRNRY